MGDIAKTTAETAREDINLAIEELSREEAEHPGDFFLERLQMRIAPLQAFLEAAKFYNVSSESLEPISDLVHLIYDSDSSPENEASHNSLLKISEEPEPPILLSYQSITPASLYAELTSAVWTDIRRNHPSITKKMIREWCVLIKKLEVGWSGILAVSTLLATVRSKDHGGSRQVDLMRRLIRAWSGFRSTYKRLYESTALGNLAFAVDEMRKTIAKSENKNIPLGDLPKRLYLRYHDCQQGRGGAELEQVVNEVSLEQLLDSPEADTFLATHSELIELEPVDVQRAIAKLPPKEREAVEHVQQGKTLTVSGRKAKERAILKLRNILL